MKMIAYLSAFKAAFITISISTSLTVSSLAQTSRIAALVSITGHTATLSFSEGEPGNNKTGAGLLNPALKEFRGKKNKEGVQLSWQMNNDASDGFFEIQRSLSGGSYVKIGSMVSTKTNKYEFIDKSIIQPAYYYRVKIINTEGTISYSAPILVEAKTAPKPVVKKKAISNNTTSRVVKSAPVKKAVVLKNPKQFSSSVLHFNDQLIFNISLSKKAPIQVHVSTLQGRVSLHRSYAGSLGNNEIVVDSLGLLPSGNYTVVVKCNGQKFNLIAKK